MHQSGLTTIVGKPQIKYVSILILEIFIWKPSRESATQTSLAFIFPISLLIWDNHYRQQWFSLKRSPRRKKIIVVELTIAFSKIVTESEISFSPGSQDVSKTVSTVEGHTSRLFITVPHSASSFCEIYDCVEIISRSRRGGVHLLRRISAKSSLLPGTSRCHRLRKHSLHPSFPATLSTQHSIHGSVVHRLRLSCEDQGKRGQRFRGFSEEECTLGLGFQILV